VSEQKPSPSSKDEQSTREPGQQAPLDSSKISSAFSSTQQQPAMDPQETPTKAIGAGTTLEEADSWPLQADRLAITMPLVGCLQLLAGHYGRRTSSVALTAGLPIPLSGITPALLIRAAERADMNMTLAERSLESLAIAPTLPCIMALEERQACILWDIEYPVKHPPKKNQDQKIELHPETRFIVQFPETPDEKKSLTLEDFKTIYIGYSFFARPVARIDDRAGPATIDTGRDWFWSAFWEHRTLYGEVVLASVIINIFGIAGSLYVMNVYDRVVPNKAFETLWVLAIGILIVYFFDFMLRNLRSNFLDHAGRKADVKISAALFEQVLGMTMPARPASAGVLAANMREFETLRDFFTSATMVAFIDLPFVFFYILIIGVIGGPIALVPLLAVPVVIALGFYFQKRLAKAVKESLQESALKNALLFETIIGLETIKVQAAEGHSQRNWEELTEKASRTAVKTRHVSSLAQNSAMLVQQIVSALIIVVGVYMISEGMMTQGALVASVLLSGRAMGPLGQVAGLLTRFSQSRETLKQLDDLMKKPVERPDGKHFITMPHVEGRVEFRDVVFAYPGQSTPAVNHLSFMIEPGDRVGVIGAVGSGKTTLERLLINLYEPSEGSVQIDGTDVRQIAPGDLRRNVGAVQQSPQLFFGSVRQNITMGHETAPDRAVLRAAELSGVMEFLKDSAAGLDTQVGERGEALSGGQRQAVAIARALLYDPPILILDEPTASMDPASENRLKKRLHEICKTKTTILITHKGTMLGLVDKLILIDRGRLVAYGPKDDVIRKLQARQYGTAAEDTEV
jgi:ATP-binding cassette subfamily C protein LapB